MSNLTIFFSLKAMKSSFTQTIFLFCATCLLSTVAYANTCPEFNEINYTSILQSSDGQWSGTIPESLTPPPPTGSPIIQKFDNISVNTLGGNVMQMDCKYTVTATEATSLTVQANAVTGTITMIPPNHFYGSQFSVTDLSNWTTTNDANGTGLFTCNNSVAACQFSLNGVQALTSPF